jgi:hypothetical protein
LRAKNDQTEKRFGRGRPGRSGLLVAGLCLLLIFTGSAFSDSLNIRIRNLIRIPSFSGLPLSPGDDPSAPGGTAEPARPGVVIRALRVLSARAILTPPAPVAPGVRTATTRPAFGTPGEIFNPDRFNSWDRKHLSTG